jgi:hypothetical protein
LRHRQAQRDHRSERLPTEALAKGGANVEDQQPFWLSALGLTDLVGTV